MTLCQTIPPKTTHLLIFWENKKILMTCFAGQRIVRSWKFPVFTSLLNLSHRLYITFSFLFKLSQKIICSNRLWTCTLNSHSLWISYFVYKIFPNTNNLLTPCPVFLKCKLSFSSLSSISIDVIILNQLFSVARQLIHKLHF